MFPDASIAMLRGFRIDPAAKPKVGDKGAPLGLNSLIVPPPLAIQIVPAPSIAIAFGKLTPPPVKPVAGEIGRP